MSVTPSFFRVLGVQPFLGRTLTDAEGELGNHFRIVLSYGLWQSAFGGDRAIVDRDVRIDGQTYTIVGVMPQDFVYLRPDVMLWRSLAFTPTRKSTTPSPSTSAVVRLLASPGTTRPLSLGGTGRNVPSPLPKSNWLTPPSIRPVSHCGV